MCKSSTGAARLANVLLVLLIANFSVALSPAIHDRVLLRNSSNFDAADPWLRDNLGYLLVRWRLIPPAQLQLPEIEIQLLKSHVQEDKNNLGAASAEYKYSAQNYNVGSMESTGQITFKDKPDEISKGVQSQGNVAKVRSAKALPDIINPPRFGCPPGQRMDQNGRCREVIY